MVDHEDTDPLYSPVPGRPYGHGTSSHAGVGPKNYRRSEKKIRTDLCERLTRHPAIDASDLEVMVDGSAIVVRGTVDSAETRQLVEREAREACGAATLTFEVTVAGDGERARDQDRSWPPRHVVEGDFSASPP